MEQVLTKYDKIPEAETVVKYINSRFKREGKGTNVFVIGLPGTGKSSGSQRIGELILESRPNENLNIYIVDSLIKLIEAIRSSKQGDVIVIEEVSVLFPSRRAMGSENLAIGKIFDTIRKKRLCLISNCPIWTSIDKHMKCLGDVLIQTLRIVKTAGVVVSKFYRLQTDPASGKTYTHTMMRNGMDVKLMITKMPNLERWSEYETTKDKFMDELYKELLEKQLKKKKKSDKDNEKRGVTKEERRAFIKCHPNLSTKELAERFKVDIRQIYYDKKDIKNEEEMNEK